MYSRPLAFILLLVACVVAAAGGAYIATRQNLPLTPVAASQPTPAEPQSPSSVQAARRVAGEGAGGTGDQASERVDGLTAEPAPGATNAGPPRAAEQSADNADRVSRAPARPRSAAPARAETARAPSPGAVPADVPTGAAPGSASAGTPPAAAEPVPPVTQPPDVPARDRQASPAPAQREFAELVVPAESVLGLQLETTVTSEQARVEDRVEARVTRDVRIGEQVAIPAGSRVAGSVVLVDRGGKVKDRARLGVQFDTLTLPDSTRLSIRTEAVYREGASPAGQSAAKIGGATVGGAILGAIIGGGKGAAIGGSIGAAGGTAAVMAGDRRPAILTSGTVVSVRLLSPVTVTVEK